MNDHVVVSVQDEDIFVVVQEQDQTTASSNLYNPISVDRVIDIGDVDSSLLLNGSLLVYNTTTSKWVTTQNIPQLNVDNLQLDGNTLSTVNADGDLFITPNGDGRTVVTNLYIGNTSIDEYILSQTGGALEAGIGIDTSFNSEAGITTISAELASSTNAGIASFSSNDFELSGTGQNLASLKIVNTNVGQYGSSTSIPVITVDAKGRVTAVSTESISTSLNITGNTGSGIITLGEDTLAINGSGSITASVSDTTVTIGVSDASTSAKGVASFDENNFNVVSGAVSIKSGSITNLQLSNTNITIGTTSVSLGGSTSYLEDLLGISVGNISIDGNEISSIDDNGNIVLNPDGTGVVDVSGSRITNVGAPTSNADAATKAYVDSVVSGLDWKSSVNLLASSNITLADGSGSLSIDGHTALEAEDSGYRLLLTGQTNPTENGIYVYTDNGTSYTLDRSTDADEYTEIIGAAVYVLEGSVYQNTAWVQTNHYLTSFGSPGNYQSWVQFAGAGSYVDGAGLSLTGNVFSVNVAANSGLEIVSDNLTLKSTLAGHGLTLTSGVLAVGGVDGRITVNENNVDIASTYIGQTSITTLGTITTGVWNSTVISPIYGGTGLTEFAVGDLLYASGETSLARLASSTEGKILQISSLGLPVWGDIDCGTY
jgi:hypothetical protein